MQIRYILKDDYDQKEKLKKEKIFCYSKKKLNDLYSEKDYKIVGEISGKTINKEDIKPDQRVLEYNGLYFLIEDYGTANKIIYARKRFISVDNDEYVVLLNNRIIFILLFGIISLFIGLLLLFILRFGSDLLNPIPVVDPNLDKIEGDTSEKIDSEEGGGSVSIAYALEANLSLATNDIAMILGNPNESNHQFVAELYIENGDSDICIAKSGLISPGYQLSVMKFNNQAQLSSGSYQGYYYLKFYNPETGELALVDSKIENVVITVN